MAAAIEKFAISRRRPSNRLVLLALVLGATAFTCFMNAALISAALRGHFADPDDAMRLVEVRAWLGGQAWFDMNAARLDPPVGSILHWSRLVDLPVAAMIRLFGLFVERAPAERLAEIAVPTLWLVLLYIGIARLATLLVGRAGRPPALLGMMLSGATLVQFGPGRIGHHAPEILGLVFATGAALAALDSRFARQAAVAGGLVALSLAMSLETLPFQVVLIGSVALLWIWRGQELAAALLWLAIGLLAALPLFFLLTVRPSLWLAPACDAYSAAHLGAGLIGAAGLLLAARLTPYLTSRLRRLAAVGVPAVLAIGYLAFAYPACLHSPFAGVDPLVRELWLDHVSESLPLPAFTQMHPMIGTAIIGPVVLGFIGNIVGARSARGLAQQRFFVLAILSGFGLAMGFWQMRVFVSVTPLALCGGVYLVMRLQARLASHGMALAAAFAPGAIVAFTSTAWALALPSDAGSPADKTEACLAPDAIAPLASLPPGTAVAPINSGSHLLEATRLSVFAAPYHRNDDGNRFAFEVLMAQPAEAAKMLLARRVDYVITCPGMASAERVAARAPDGLAARLAAGQIPPFLAERHLGATPYRVYAVQPPPP